MDEFFLKQLADTLDGFYQGGQMILKTMAQKLEADRKAQAAQKQKEQGESNGNTGV